MVKKIIVKLKKRKKKGKKEKKTLSQTQKQSVVVNVNQPLKRMYSRQRNFRPKNSTMVTSRPMLLDNQSAGQSAINNFQNVYGIRLTALDKKLNGITGNMSNLTNVIQNLHTPPLVPLRPASVLNKKKTEKYDPDAILKTEKNEKEAVRVFKKRFNVRNITEKTLQAAADTDRAAEQLKSDRLATNEKALFENLKADQYFQEEELTRPPVKMRYGSKRQTQYPRNIFDLIKSGEITEPDAIKLTASVEFREQREKEQQLALDFGGGLE